ncbi:MAG: hypothetical protein Tsb0034_17340 [Ekhidna sp.]
MSYGIDIVDLSDPKLKPRDQRALNKILHQEDLVPDHPYIYWLLWSAKEAVFKSNREAINFAPTLIPIALELVSDSIHFTCKNLKGNIVVNDQYILAVCADDPESINYQTFIDNDGMSGEALRNKIIQFFSEKKLTFDMGSDELNLPILLPSNTPISISHHGIYGAFAYPKSLLNG